MQHPLFVMYLLILGFLGDVVLGSHISKRTGHHAKRASSDVNNAVEVSLWNQHSSLVDSVKAAMLASIRTSWEQGTAAQAMIETDNPEYSVFSPTPFQAHGTPTSTLQLALSAAVRQTKDGRLSQNINDGEDSAALDGASSGPAVMLGSFAPNSRGGDYWSKAAESQMSYIKSVKRTSTGAISQRADGLQYWADGVFMGPPFIAYYGAIKKDQEMLQLAYDNCRLYRDALLVDGPTGKLWAHIYDDGKKQWVDKGIWGTGLAWASLGMSRVAATIHRSTFSSQMSKQLDDLNTWTKEILDGGFAALTEDNLVPNYIQGGAGFGDCAASSALVSVAYRSATLFPETFGSNYTQKAGKVRDAVIKGIDDMGLLSPLVDPLSFNATGTLSTEGQAFGLMMFAAWKAWLGQ